MKHRYLVRRKISRATFDDCGNNLTSDEYKYFWADEQFDSMSDFWFMFPQDYDYKIFIRFFVDGEEYVEGIWHEASWENSCCHVEYPAHFEELYYHKAYDHKDYPEPIVQRALGMRRDKDNDYYSERPPLLIKKSFIDKWDKLNADQYAMEQQFEEMVEQVKKGVA